MVFGGKKLEFSEESEDKPEMKARLRQKDRLPVSKRFSVLLEPDQRVLKKSCTHSGFKLVFRVEIDLCHQHRNVI